MPVRPDLSGGVLCCGNIVWDILARPVERLAWNTTAWVDSIEQHMGGNGANTTYTLGLLETPVRLLAAIGRDSFGDQLRQRLAAAAVDLKFLQSSESPTATTIALVNAAGDRMFLHRPGASAGAFATPVEFSPGLVAGMSHFHLANPFAVPGLRRHAAEIVRRTRAASLTVSVDTGWDTQGRWLDDLGACLPSTDLLFVNEEEARMLAGTRDTTDACHRLLALGARIVVVKLGAAGCAVWTGELEIRAPAFDVPVVDTTGAGDCFAGAFLAALHRGRSLEEAAEFANAIAALTIQQLGASAGVRSYEDTEAWIRTAARRA
jgi:sugar/nucleoside kinase (ribokinase family)